MVTKTQHRERSGCPIACSLDVLGDHWTLIIIRNLMFAGLHEYKDMLKTDEQISSNILSDRLKRLECHGVINSIPHPESGKRKLYFLTPMGKDLIHVMVDMVLWGDKHLSESIKIPKDQKDKLEFIKSSPDTFKAIILKELEVWEEQYLS